MSATVVRAAVVEGRNAFIATSQGAG
jgi:hypothetical protein